MPTFEEIYAHHADKYERLIRHEDYKGNLRPALERIRPLAGLDVVEFGAGTGRLTRLLAPLVNSIRAYDASAHMLDANRRRMAALGLGNWQLAVADNRALPLPDDMADLAIEGWSFGHATEWYPDTWREEIRAALAEMQRVLRPGGTAVVIEPLGTGTETPAPPNENLAALYALLVTEYGAQSAAIRTDYRFPSRAEGEEALFFFFGPRDFAHLSEEPFIVPECTGLWWFTV